MFHRPRSSIGSSRTRSRAASKKTGGSRPRGPQAPQGARRGPAQVARADRARLAPGAGGPTRRWPHGSHRDQRTTEKPSEEARVSGGYYLSPEARANLDEICAFVADDSVDAALRVLDALEDAFEQLAAMPEI